MKIVYRAMQEIGSTIFGTAQNNAKKRYYNFVVPHGRMPRNWYLIFDTVWRDTKKIHQLLLYSVLNHKFSVMI